MTMGPLPMSRTDLIEVSFGMSGGYPGREGTPWGTWVREIVDKVWGSWRKKGLCGHVLMWACAHEMPGPMEGVQVARSFLFARSLWNASLPEPQTSLEPPHGQMSKWPYEHMLMTIFAP